MPRAGVSVFLAFALILNGSVRASDGKPVPPESHAIRQQEKPNSALQDSPRQANQQVLLTNGAKLELTDGTPVQLRFARSVVSSQVIAGEKVPLEVAEPLLVGNMVVVSPHAPAEATVTMAQPNHGMGRGGNLELKVESICLADGERVSVRAVKDVKGKGNQPLALAGMAGTAGIAYAPVAPLFFLFYVKGKNASIPAGAQITAYIAGDVSLDPSKFKPVGTNLSPKNGSE